MVGYEGHRGDSALSWGSAAVLMDGILVNAVSGMGRAQSDEEIAEMAASGTITLLPNRREIPECFGACVLEATEEARGILKLDAGDFRAITETGPDSTFYVFTSHAVFDAFRRRVADALSTHILFGMAHEGRIRAIEVGRVLSAHHPVLNALSAWYCGREWDSARALVRGPGDLWVFDRAKRMLQNLG